MKSLLLLLLILPLTANTACAWPFSKRDRPPEHQMIEKAYFICDRCQSCQGGIYGKGPTKHFRSANGPKCIHAWRRVSHDQFKRYAAKNYGANWRAETGFWSQDH
jgi:hypothetical protein